MPTLPILIEVEAEAVGPMLIMLKRTAGVVKFHVVLDDEEKGPLLPPGNRHTGSKDAVLRLFAERGGGPLSIGDVVKAIGGSRSRAHGALHYLKKRAP
jgi:hypothetical protein